MRIRTIPSHRRTEEESVSQLHFRRRQAPALAFVALSVCLASRRWLCAYIEPKKPSLRDSRGLRTRTVRTKEPAAESSRKGLFRSAITRRTRADEGPISDVRHSGVSGCRHEWPHCKLPPPVEQRIECWGQVSHGPELGTMRDRLSTTCATEGEFFCLANSCQMSDSQKCHCAHCWFPELRNKLPKAQVFPIPPTDDVWLLSNGKGPVWKRNDFQSKKYALSFHKQRRRTGTETMGKTHF